MNLKLRGIENIILDLLERALAEANRIEEYELRDKVLAILAVLSAKIGRVDYVEESIRKIKSQQVLLTALKKVVAEMSERGYYPELSKILDNVANCLCRHGTELIPPTVCNSDDISEYAIPKTELIDLRDELLRSKAIRTISLGDLDKAKAIIIAITNPYIRAMMLSDLATAYARKGLYGRAIRLFSEALEIINEMNNLSKFSLNTAIDKDIIYRNMTIMAIIALKMQQAGLKRWSKEVLRSLIETIKKLRNKQEEYKLVMHVIRAARRIGGNIDITPIESLINGEIGQLPLHARSTLLKELSLYYHKEGELNKFVKCMDRAIEYAENIDKNNVREKTLLEIAKDCMDAGILGCPQIIANKLTNDIMKIKVICDLSSKVAKNGYINYAVDLLNRVQENINTETKKRYKVYWLGNVLNILISSGEIDKAQRLYVDLIRLLGKIRNQYYRAAILGMILSMIIRNNGETKKVGIFDENIEIANIDRLITVI